MNLKFKTVRSDQLFYGEFQWSASFQLQEAWIFRYTLDHAEIDDRLTKQQNWRDKMRERWPAGQVNRYHAVISDVVRDNIHQMADFIQTIDQPYKLVVESKTLRLYTNDRRLLDIVEHISFVTRKRYSEVIVDRARNTILLKNPRHKYRSYFKETQIAPDDRAAITRFLLGQPGIRIGQGLKDWMEGRSQAYISKYTRDYFFVDYDHENWLTMLSLVRPGLIRKTVHIVAK